MAPTFHPLIRLDNRLGAIFIGGIITGIFYGMICVQSYIYFMNYQKDNKWLKTAILVLWILNTLHLALIIHGLYIYIVSNFGNYLIFSSPPVWSILFQVCISNLSELIVRWIFGRRVWLLSKKNNLFVVCLALISLLCFASGIGFTVYAFIGIGQNLPIISAMLYIGLASGIAADTLIATFLCVNLWYHRTGFKKTKSLVRTLMMYTINTALLTTICYTACLICYAVGEWPDDFVFMAIFFPLSSLFVNSLLASLNSREALSEKNRGVTHVSMPASILDTNSQSAV